jgi:predicted butyrate kinase (DUF1464 family)
MVVGFAIVIGITQFGASAVEANRDQVISDLVYLTADAQSYFKKQEEFGGGAGSYTGWDIPQSFQKHENNKKYIKVKVKKNKVVLNAYGTEIGNNGKGTIRIKATVTPTDIKYVVKN